MKIYDFANKKRKIGRVVFALSLDRKRMTERIVIGEENEARRILNGGDGEVYYDEVRPLGSLLLTFESDINGEWNRRIQILQESYSKIMPLQTTRWKTVAPVVDFLNEKYNSGEPSAMYAAIRTWEDYLNFFHQNRGATMLSDRLFMLYKPFKHYGDKKPWQKEAPVTIAGVPNNAESQVELWYPAVKRPFETVVAFSSFQPVIFYYRHKVDEWKLVFQGCKVCGKYFLARSRHYELCSDDCRKQKSLEAKREFVERVKDDKLEQLDKSTYYYWYNRWRKLSKGKNANTDAAAAFKVEFDKFRKDAIKHKAAVKRRKMQAAEFSSWLVTQQNEADRLMEELIQKRHDQ